MQMYQKPINVFILIFLLLPWHSTVTKDYYYYYYTSFPGYETLSKVCGVWNGYNGDSEIIIIVGC